MDAQIRNFKDFLQLYNKITELCFSQCVDNFHNRIVSSDESLCVDKCLQKFTRVNQRVMNVYVDVQTEINQRRMVELESLTEEQQAKISATLSSNEGNSNSNHSTSSLENKISEDKIISLDGQPQTENIQTIS